MSISEVITAIEAGNYDEMKQDSNYKEIFKPEQMLLHENIPYRLRVAFDGFQIGYPELPSPSDDTVCSVIEHFGSYGHENDLLEIRGLTQNDGEVEGYLTAEDVFNRILAHYKGCEMKQ